MKEIFENIIGFDWDEGNFLKNKLKHDVSNIECEEVFFNYPRLVYEDLGHSNKENRFIILGKTSNDRKLCIIFTIRLNKLRIISARDMSRKERKIYG